MKIVLTNRYSKDGKNLTKDGGTHNHDDWVPISAAAYTALRDTLYGAIIDIDSLIEVLRPILLGIPTGDKVFRDTLDSMVAMEKTYKPIAKAIEEEMECIVSKTAKSAES